MIPVTDTLSIEDDEISEKFVRASGPGGQHVNTSSSVPQHAQEGPSQPLADHGVVSAPVTACTLRGCL